MVREDMGVLVLLSIVLLREHRWLLECRDASDCCMLDCWLGICVQVLVLTRLLPWPRPKVNQDPPPVIGGAYSVRASFFVSRPFSRRQENGTHGRRGHFPMQNRLLRLGWVFVHLHPFKGRNCLFFENFSKCVLITQIFCLCLYRYCRTLTSI